MPQESLPPKSGKKLPQIRTKVLVALGSNRSSREGAPEEVVKKGIAALAKCFGVIRSTSPLYQTPAFPPGSGADYINAVVLFETDAAPHEIIKSLHEIEAQMGRTRKKRWGARTLDLDLIAMGQVVLPDSQTHAEWRALPLPEQMSRAPDLLIVPHPRVQERAFVLVPLADVAPDWRHPALGLTVRQMLDALPSESLSEVREFQIKAP